MIAAIFIFSVCCSRVRRAPPHGAFCLSCWCGAEVRHRRAKPGLEMVRCAHQCPGPSSPLVEDSDLLSLRASFGRGHGMARAISGRTLPTGEEGLPWYGRSSFLRCQIQEGSWNRGPSLKRMFVGPPDCCVTFQVLLEISAVRQSTSSKSPAALEMP